MGMVEKDTSMQEKNYQGRIYRKKGVKEESCTPLSLPLNHSPPCSPKKSGYRVVIK
jgi:hypothetical protein